MPDILDSENHCKLLIRFKFFPNLQTRRVV